MVTVLALNQRTMTNEHQAEQAWGRAELQLLVCANTHSDYGDQRS